MQAKLSLCLKLFGLLLCAYVLFSPAAQATRQQTLSDGTANVQMVSANRTNMSSQSRGMAVRFASPFSDLRSTAALRIQEPSTMLFFGAGLVSVAVLARRRSKRLAK